jgi:hypothetical protein
MLARIDTQTPRGASGIGGFQRRVELSSCPGLTQPVEPWPGNPARGGHRPTKARLVSGIAGVTPRSAALRKRTPGGRRPGCEPPPKPCQFTVSEGTGFDWRGWGGCGWRSTPSGTGRVCTADSASGHRDRCATHPARWATGLAWPAHCAWPPAPTPAGIPPPRRPENAFATARARSS